MNSSSLIAPIEAEILFVFSLKTKRLQRKAGTVFVKKHGFSAPKTTSIQKKSIRAGKFTFIVRKSKLWTL